MFSFSSLNQCLRSLSRINRTSLAALCKASVPNESTLSRYPHHGLKRCISTSAYRRDLMEFFDDKKNWGAQEVRVGRSWKTEELRLKSNQDLHKLWYVLLKERNMLLTAEHFYEKTEKELFPNPERIDKVEESMKNLEQVVKERNKAYYQLEVSESEDGCRPVRRERNEFGIVVDRPLTEHAEPETDETRYRGARPYRNKDVANFLKLKRQQERTEANREKRRRLRYVVGLLKRYPDLDDDLLREKFPDVDIDMARRDKRVRGNHPNWL